MVAEWRCFVVARLGAGQWKHGAVRMCQDTIAKHVRDDINLTVSVQQRQPHIGTEDRAAVMDTGVFDGQP